MYLQDMNVINETEKAVQVLHSGVPVWLKKSWFSASGELKPQGVKQLEQTDSKNPYSWAVGEAYVSGTSLITMRRQTSPSSIFIEDYAMDNAVKDYTENNRSVYVMPDLVLVILDGFNLIIDVSEAKEKQMLEAQEEVWLRDTDSDSVAYLFE